MPFPFRVLFTLPFPFICPFRLLFGDPPVSSGRFLASFPFEPASNLTPAFPAVFPGSVVALLFVSCLFLFESSSRFLFLSFFLFGSRFLFLSFFLFGSSSESRGSSRLLFGDPPVSSGRFLVSFPFEPASNLTPAFPAVFPGFRRRLPFPVPLSLFESSSRLLFVLFSFSCPVLFVPFCFLFVSFRSGSRPLRSLSRPLRSLVFLSESSSKGRRSRRPGFGRVCQCFVNKTQQRRFRLQFSFSFAVFPFPDSYLFLCVTLSTPVLLPKLCDCKRSSLIRSCQKPTGPNHNATGRWCKGEADD